MTVQTRTLNATRQIKQQRVRSFTVELPYPPASLSQNARGNWRVHYPEQAQARMDGYLAALVGMNECAYDVPRETGVRYEVRVQLYPPDRRRRDVHNAFGALKFGVDGIASAMDVDDSRFVRWVIEPFGEMRSGGAVVLTFEEMR